MSSTPGRKPTARMDRHKWQQLPTPKAVHLDIAPTPLLLPAGREFSNGVPPRPGCLTRLDQSAKAGALTPQEPSRASTLQHGCPRSGPILVVGRTVTMTTGTDIKNRVAASVAATQVFHRGPSSMSPVDASAAHTRQCVRLSAPFRHLATTPIGHRPEHITEKVLRTSTQDARLQ